MANNKWVEEKLACYHCGQPCDHEIILFEDKNFCCAGCKMVFDILTENNLCEYYSYEKTPGTSLRYVSEETYSFLDEPAVKKKILSFDSDSFCRVQFYVAAIHCISCIWLLENLQRLKRGILKSEVNFSRKQVTIDYNPLTAILMPISSVSVVGFSTLAVNWVSRGLVQANSN